MRERRRQDKTTDLSGGFFWKKTGRNTKENLSRLSVMEFFRCIFTKTETVWQLDLRFCCFFEGATQAKLSKTHHPQNSWNLAEGSKTSKICQWQGKMGRCCGSFCTKKKGRCFTNHWATFHILDIQVAASWGRLSWLGSWFSKHVLWLGWLFQVQSTPY